MKRTTLAKKLRIALAVMAFAGCATSFAADGTADAAASPAAKTQNEMKRQLTREATYMEEQLTLTQEWDKTFPKSDKVNHRKVTFHNRYGITLAADLYEPKRYEGKLAAIAVCGPFGAVKEQASGLYAQTRKKSASSAFAAGAAWP